MSTVLTLQELPCDLAALIRRMHERTECIVVKDDKGPVAYLNLAFRPDLRQQSDPDFSDIALPEAHPRISYDKRTCLPVVNARVGARLVTAEEIYEELREDFP
jgi:hypothetical protein